VSSEIELIILVAAGTGQSDREVLIVTAVQGLINPDGGSRFGLAICCCHPQTTESLNQKCILVTKHSLTYTTGISTSSTFTAGVEKIHISCIKLPLYKIKFEARYAATIKTIIRPLFLTN
jgi:hypothetical protein